MFLPFVLLSFTLSFLFFFQYSDDLLDLHSFPTRRSSDLIWTLIGLLAAVAALRFAMDATKVDTEHLCAALSAYLLAGTCFGDRKSTRLNSSHTVISYAVFCLKKKKYKKYE